MRRRAACTLPLLALLPGCATRRELALDVALFPHATIAADARAPGRVALQVPSAVRDQMHEGKDGPARALRIPVGRIVAQALQTAADEAFAGGAEVVDLPVPARHAATLVLQAVRVEYHQHLSWMIPLPILGGIGDAEFDVQLAIDVSLLDAMGRSTWTHSYDDGRQVWPHEWTEQGKAMEGIVRLTHEAAWRLAQRAVADVRAWVEADRMRPRRL